MARGSLWEHLDEIEQIVRRQPLGLISDFDGVLSEIAPTPATARIHPECQTQIAQLSQRLPFVAILSGRPVDNTKALVALEGVTYYGNHGLERWSGNQITLVPEATAYREVISRIIREVGPAMPAGVIIEDKRVGLTLHYRQSPDQASAREAILAALDSMPTAQELKVSFPKGAVELRVPIDIDKGTVVLNAAKEYALRSCIYLGDDRTDLDAFWAMSELARRVDFRGVSIGVGGPETPAEIIAMADYTLDGVPDVAKFLAWLAEAVAA